MIYLILYFSIYHLKYNRRQMRDKSQYGSTKRVKECADMRLLKEKIKVLQGGVNAAQNAAKYWEDKYYSKVNETLETKNLNRIRDVIDNYYNSKGDSTTHNIEKKINKHIETLKKIKDVRTSQRHMQRNHRKYAKLNKFETEIKTFKQDEINNKKPLEETMEYKAIEPPHKLNNTVNNYDQLENLRIENKIIVRETEASKVEGVIKNLREQIETLEVDKKAYASQIELLTMKLSMLSGKRNDMIKSEVTEVIGSLQENKGNNEYLAIISSAEDRVKVLEEELRVQEERFKKMITDHNNAMFMLKEKLKNFEKENSYLKRKLEKAEGFTRDVNKKEIVIHEVFKVKEVARKEVVPVAYIKKKTEDKFIEKEESNTKSNHSKKVEARKEEYKEPVFRPKAQYMKSIDQSSDSEQSINKPAYKKQVDRFESLKTEEVFSRWNKFQDDENMQAELLKSIYNDSRLESRLIINSLQEYLLILRQSFTSKNISLSTAAVICLSNLLKLKKLSKAELRELSCNKLAVDSLAAKREGESEEDTMRRHLAGLNLLHYMDKVNLKWTQSMTKHITNHKGIEELMKYFEECKGKETIAAKAAQTIMYMASFKENIEFIKQSGIYISILKAIASTDSTELKENGIDCLASLLQDSDILNNIANDIGAKCFINELRNESIKKTHEEKVLSCLEKTTANGSSPIVSDPKLNNVLVKIIKDKEKYEEENIMINALKIVANVAIAQFPVKNIKALASPLADLIENTKNNDVLLQALITVQTLIKNDKGRSHKDYGELGSSVLDCINNVNAKVTEEALKAFAQICAHPTPELLKEGSEILGDIVTTYTNAKDMKSISSIQEIIKHYAKNGYNKVINANATKAFYNKVVESAISPDDDTKKAGLGILINLLNSLTVVKKVLEIEEVKGLLEDIIESVSAPIYLEPKDE